MEKLTKELKTLIDKQVELRVREIKGNVKEYKDFLEGFKETLDRFEIDGKTLLEDMKENGLSLNQAESEGFLRAVITIKNTLIDDMKYINAT